jgi:mannosylglycerate hydrolase
LLHGWKELLKGHPHDDIGGCSVDAVHEEDVDRFRRAQQVGRTISSQALGDIGRRIRSAEGRGIVVYNPLSLSSSGEVALRIPFRKAALPREAQLHDPSGRIVPSTIAWEGFSENLPEDRRSDIGELSVAFLAEDVPPCGYRLYTLKEGEQRQLVPQPDGDAPSIENEFFRVSANPDGTLNLTDKRTESTHEGLHFFENVEDAGDEYDYSPLPAYRTVTITSRDNAARIEVRQPVSYKQTLEMDLELTIPGGLTPDRTARSDKMVSLPIHTTATVYRGIGRVDFETTVENRARDHRLRVGFPTGIRSFYAFAESKFDVVRRALRIPRYTQRYYQPPVSTQHVETFVDVHDGERGFALLNRGLPEYEARREATGVTLYQTLFRSVGWLSRPDLQTRREGAGPAIQTPGAQMLGTWTFHYSIVPHRGTWEEARIWQAAHAFSVPLVAHECQPGQGDLPAELSFLSAEPPTIPVSAIKRSESGKGIIVRLFNPTPREVNVSLRFFRPLARAHRVRLDEGLVATLPVSDGNRVNLSLGKKEVVTVELIPVRKRKRTAG